MAKTLGEMFPEVVNPQQKKQETGTAAQLIKNLTDTETKDMQISLRMNSNVYSQLKVKAAKKGMPVSVLITMLIKEFLNEE